MTRPFLAYGFLALPLAFAGMPLYLHIPDFYTREMGLGVASAGAILMFLRLLDAVQDPVVGYFSDKSVAAQKMIMVFGAAALLAGMGALLSGPPPQVSVALWFAGGVVLTGLGLSMVNINFIAIGSLSGVDEAARLRVSGVRESFSLVGLLLASVLPGLLAMNMDRPLAFLVFYFVFAFLLIAGAWAFSRFYAGIPVASGAHMHGGFAAGRLPLAFFCRNAGFLSACFLTHAAAALAGVLFLYFATDYLRAGPLTGLFLCLYFVAGAVFMPAWTALARRFSPRIAWMGSMALAAGSFVWAYGLGAGDTIQYGVVCVLSGMALGADLALPPVMLARRLQAQQADGYSMQAFAVMNLLPKLALAFATGLSFIILDSAGFRPGDAAGQGLPALAALYALVPCVIKLFSAFIVFFLTNGDLHDNQKRSSDHEHTNGA